MSLPLEDFNLQFENGNFIPNNAILSRVMKIIPKLNERNALNILTINVLTNKSEQACTNEKVFFFLFAENPQY